MQARSAGAKGRSTTSGARLRALLRAGLAARRGAWPVAPMVVHGSLCCGLALLVRDALGPFAYALWALSIHGALVAVPLLGDLGTLLREDPAGTWMRAQPVRERELALARLLVAGLVVGSLAAAGLAPFAILAPSGLPWSWRLALVTLGLAQLVFVAGCLLTLDALSDRIGRGLTLGAQAALVLGSALGLLLAPRLVPRLRALDGPSEALAAWPPAWFSAPLAAHPLPGAWSWAAPLALVAALALLLARPRTPPMPLGRRGDLVGSAVKPLRALARRVLLRTREERGVFELVCDALPLEREFALRVLPLLALPLVFLAFAAAAQGGERDGLCSLALFSPGMALPALVAHVPISESAEARWLLATAPLPRAALREGTLAALFVRWLAPLLVLLVVAAGALVGPTRSLELAPAASLVAALVLRRSHDRLVEDPPLSVLPTQLRVSLDWTGSLIGLGVGLAVLALLAARYISTPLEGLAAAAPLVLLERWLARRPSAPAP